VYSVARTSWKSSQTSPFTIVASTLLFTLHPLVVQYSQEAKQYPLDMAIMLTLFLIYQTYRQNPSPKQELLFVLATIVSFLFSYSTPFALGGIGMCMLFTWYQHKKIRIPETYTFIPIVLGLGGIYFLFYQPNHTSHLH
jgi:hypothetical protein